ncbi:hypothetical protein [Candidatus Uabimicrobium sp. HlEnr_7]|uniref:hypothetical protein n=1 Tax=Candidatus Uabimicrobium helgolandensis TaxID=3095367 RepID=UPI0035570272
MEKTKTQAKCANCNSTFYVPHHLLNQKRPCPTCKKILLLSTTPIPKVPIMILVYSGIFFLLTILFMLVWLSMVMQVMRSGGSGIVPTIAIGVVVLSTLVFISLSLMQGKIFARYGLYLFMTINTCGAVWQHQQLQLYKALNMISDVELHQEIVLLFSIQISFLLLVYTPLLLILRRERNKKSA